MTRPCQSSLYSGYIWGLVISEKMLSQLFFALFFMESALQYLERRAAAAKSLQSCPTLCNPVDGSPPGSLVPGILQARTLEWVAISFSNAWKWKVKVKSFSRVRLLATPWTAAHKAPPSMGFSRQEYWSGVPLPSPKEGQRTQKRKVSAELGLEAGGGKNLSSL